jgi:ferredoxin-NADP reductase
LTLRIREVLPATPRARIVRIDLDGHLYPYKAGQALLLADHGYTQRKPYSIAASPGDAAREGYLELLVGVDATGSPGQHLTLTPGAAVDVDGPTGGFTFPAAPPEDCLIFVAGGTGIAPLRAMLRETLAGRRRRIGVLYSARTPDDFAYQQELESLEREGQIELRLTVTRDVAADRWAGTRGRIGSDELASLVHGAETLCFVCGPPSLVARTATLLGELGIPPHRIRAEEWGEQLIADC